MSKHFPAAANAALLLVAGLAAGPVAAQAAAPAPALAPAPAAASASGLAFDARLRFEQVDDEAFARRADAGTLRLRLGWRTPERAGWSALVELEHTSHLGGEAFNSSANGRTAYPTVADPDNTELNQLYLKYQPSTATRLTIGRQRLVYDNQRFIGAVGWRQNEQTFDALDVEHRFDGGFGLRYSYLGRVQRIYGADHPNPDLGRWLLDAHLLSLSHPVGPGKLTGYAYFIENRTLPLSSHRDLGLRYVAERKRPQGLGWLATAEFARQDAWADGAATIDARYALLEAGLVWRGHTLRVGRERLGGDGHYGFATPLATLHAFNGWADKFLATPVDGLDDRYLAWNRKFGRLAATVAWHDFRADAGARDYGSEWDASLGWALAPHWNALVKLADYRAGDVGSDARKTWLSLEYSR